MFLNIYIIMASLPIAAIMVVSLIYYIWQFDKVVSINQYEEEHYSMAELHNRFDGLSAVQDGQFVA